MPRSIGVLAALVFVLSVKAQPRPAQRAQPATKTSHAAQEEKFNKIIQDFFSDFEKTRVDTNERKAACERVVSNLRPLAEERYAPAEWALEQVYLEGQIPSTELRYAMCPSLKSEQEGFVWLRRVADQGPWAARDRLAQLSATAEGGTLDLVEAYALYDVTKQETQRSCLSKLMSVEDIERAQTLATKYRAVPNPESAYLKYAATRLGLDYCKEEYRQVVRPEANVGTDSAQISSELANLASQGPMALGDFPITSLQYSMPNGQRYFQGEAVTSLHITNQTLWPMRVLLRGKVNRAITVPAGGNGTVKVFPGNYEVGVQLGTTPSDTLRLHGEKVLKDLTYELTIAQRAAPTAANNPQGVDAGDEIARILQSGRYQSLPPLQQTRGPNFASVPRLTVRNQTSYMLRITLAGALGPRVVSLAPGTSQAIDLSAGTYKAMATVDAPNVLPAVGDYSFGNGSDYGITYTISNR